MGNRRGICLRAGLLLVAAVGATVWVAVWFAVWAAVWAGALSAHPKQREKFTPGELEPLVASLEEAGYPRAFLDRIFSDSRLRRMERVVGLNALTVESEARYAQFLSPYAIRLARKFRRRHGAKLASAEAAYSVSTEVLVAILLVETQFGRARLPYRVLDVFTTLVVESGPAGVEKHYRRLKARHPTLERSYLEARMERKGEWALRELSALLAIASAFGEDPFKIRGSYSGAFGMPQFLPSN